MCLAKVGGGGGSFFQKAAMRFGDLMRLKMEGASLSQGIIHDLV